MTSLIKIKPRSRIYYGTWFTFRTQFISVYNITDPYKAFFAKKLYGEAVIFLLKTTNYTLNEMWIISFFDAENDILYLAAKGMFCSNEIKKNLPHSNSVTPILNNKSLSHDQHRVYEPGKYRELHRIES